MSTFSGSLMSAAWATRIPMIARPFSSGDSTVLTVNVSQPCRRAGRGARRRPGWTSGKRRGAARVSVGLPARRRRSRRPSGGSSRPARPSRRPRRARPCCWSSTSKPACFERHGGRHLLRARHFAEAFLVPVLEATSRAGRPGRGTSVAPSGRTNGDAARPSSRAGSRRRRSRCAPGPGRALLALDLHLGGDGGGGVRHVEVVVRGSRTTRSRATAATTAAALQRSTSTRWRGT